MATQIDEILDAPGRVYIDNLVLVSFRKSSFLNISDYLIELNLYESIFNPVITGEILLSDSRNLIKEFGLLGDELISLTIRTPTFGIDKSISKIFRITSLEDKKFANDGSTLVYKLNFISLEAFQDLLNPIYRSFTGKPEEIVAKIYEDYLMTNRNMQISGEITADVKSPLTFLGETDNTLKFVSPGWTPLQCINWICSKTLPANNKGANFLFWETTKGFYFGNLEEILRKPELSSIGTYVYSSSKIRTETQEDNDNLTFMFNIRSLEIEKTFDQMRNLMDGYIANRLIDVDVINKTFENVDYDHGINFGNYSHLENADPVPLFDRNMTRNPLTFKDVNFSNPGLHTGIENNFSERVKYIWGNRRSSIIELNNFKMNLVIPGRTDIESGQTIYIRMPKNQGGGLSKEDKNLYLDDEMYSGYFLITNICHKINLRSHFISMSVTKDSLPYKAVKR